MKLATILEGNDVHVDERGREWKIVAREHVYELPTFLATWTNRDGYKNVGLFVQGNKETWITSIDGPYSSPKMREEWAREKGYK